MVLEMFKYLHLFVLFIFVIKKCFCLEANVSEVSIRGPQCNQSMSRDFENLKFHLPFTDMWFETKYQAQILHDHVSRTIFVLHGNELYQLLVSRQSKRLIFLGKLMGNSEGIYKHASIIFWRNYWLLVAASSNQLEIYQLPPNLLEAENVRSWKPIQQISLDGKYRRMLLSSITKEQLMLFIGQQLTTSHDQVLTFAWMDSYFDAIEQIDVPTLNTFQLMGNNSKYLLIGKELSEEDKTKLTVYRVDASSLKLNARQTLSVNSLQVHAGTFQGRKYVIACDERQNTQCQLFYWSKGQLVLRKTTGTAGRRFHEANNYLMALYGNQVRIFANEQLACYYSFKISNASALNDLLIHENGLQENFLILHYTYGFQSLIRVLEVETNEANDMILSRNTDYEELDAQNQDEHVFEASIGKLRRLLLQRRHAMNVFRQISTIITPKIAHLKLDKAIHIASGNIGVLNLNDHTLLSPVQIMQRVDKIRQQVLEKRIKRQIQDVKATSNLSLPKLKVTNLIYDGNILADFHLQNNTLNGNQAILSIATNITTNYLDTRDLLTRTNYKSHTMMHENNSTHVVKIEKLRVERINNISWAEFYDGIYLRNRDTQIQGRLIFQSNLKVENLQISILNGLLVNQLFNLRLPQTIYSDILISAFYVTDLHADKINGLNFSQDVVFSGQNVLIETPVSMHDISIAGDMMFPNNLNLTRSRDNQQLHQHYNGKVIINGSLTINRNLNTEHNKTFMWLKGLPFYATMLKNIYLLKNTPQNFKFPISFGNSKITVPALHTTWLNDHLTEHHLLASGTEQLSMPLDLVFMSAEISENLVNSNQTASQLIKLNEQIVKYGQVANISGWKIFEAPLSIDNVLTLTLNDLPVSDLVLKEQTNDVLEFTGAKSFNNILVTGKANVQENLNATYLNNFKLNDLLNYDYYYDSLNISHRLHASSVIFHKINGIYFDDIFTKFNIRNDDLVLEKTFIVEGNVTFDEDLSVDSINGINWQAYQNSLVLHNEHATILGDIEFQSDVTISRHMKTNIINDVNVQREFAHILTKSSEQNICGMYSFNELHMHKLNVSRINGIETSNLIDTRAAHTIIESDLILPRLVVNGNISGVLHNNLELSTLQAQLQRLTNMSWKNIVVHGKAIWPHTAVDQIQRQQVAYLHRNAVRRDASGQVISGNVKLIRPIIHAMHIKSPLINDIDLDFILRDSLLRNSTTMQLVVAAKTFMTNAFFTDIEVTSLLQVQTLNDIDIARFNASLYRLSSRQAIYGPLKFQTTPKIVKMQVKGSVNGMPTDVIYHDVHKPLPAVKVAGLRISDSLHIGDVNEMNFNMFLENRITKEGLPLEVFGQLTFENLVINKKALIHAINDITLDALVYRESDFMQSIGSAKHIEGNLVFEGPVHVMKLNDRDVLETHLLSIQTHKDFHFDVLTANEATFQGGLVLSQNPRSSSRPEFQDVVDLKKCNLPEREKKFEALSRLLERVEQTLRKHQNAQINYLDTDQETQILWQLPNENEEIEDKQLIELPCGSYCQRQLLSMQKSSAENRLYFQNLTSNTFNTTAHGLQVKAENFCLDKKISLKIFFNNLSIEHEFQNKFMQAMHIYAFNDNKTFLILQARDLSRKQNEALIIRLDKSIASLELQKTLVMADRGALYLSEAANMSTLMLTTIKDNEQALEVYVFKQGQYVLRQTIAGNFDLVATMNHQLILSCRQCQQIYTYAFDFDRQLYVLRQELPLETFVQQLLVFRVGHYNWYLLVLSKHQQHHYHLYKFAHIQGWLYVTHGHFDDMEMMLPLIGPHQKLAEHRNVMLVCGTSGCHVVKAVLN